MKARLFQFLTSPFCAKVRKILDYKGVEYETLEVDYLERKELLTASGQIMVPALTLQSGETIIHSVRIASVGTTTSGDFAFLGSATAPSAYALIAATVVRWAA